MKKIFLSLIFLIFPVFCFPLGTAVNLEMDSKSLGVGLSLFAWSDWNLGFYGSLKSNFKSKDDNKFEEDISPEDADLAYSYQKSRWIKNSVAFGVSYLFLDTFAPYFGVSVYTREEVREYYDSSGNLGDTGDFQTRGYERNEWVRWGIQYGMNILVMKRFSFCLGRDTATGGWVFGLGLGMFF